MPLDVPKTRNLLLSAVTDGNMLSVRILQLGVTLKKLDIGKYFMCDMTWWPKLDRGVLLHSLDSICLFLSVQRLGFWISGFASFAVTSHISHAQKTTHRNVVLNVLITRDLVT